MRLSLRSRTRCAWMVASVKRRCRPIVSPTAGVGLQVQRGLLSVRLVAESLMTAIAGFSIDDEGPNGSLGVGVLRAAPLCKPGRVNSHDERDLFLELLR